MMVDSASIELRIRSQERNFASSCCAASSSAWATRYFERWSQDSPLQTRRACKSRSSCEITSRRFWLSRSNSSPTCPRKPWSAGFEACFPELWRVSVAARESARCLKAATTTCELKRENYWIENRSSKQGQAVLETPNMIQEVILENFKSYYGVHRIKFAAGFNCIVGPNGSGKSNFIDAIQFVFGKRAANMRCKQVQQVVASGEREAAVEIRFGPGITIRRQVNSGISEYRVNGAVSTAADVQDRLRELNLECTTRFVVLQGEVEGIALMRAKTGSQETPGLLEYVEEEGERGRMEEARSEMVRTQNAFFEESERVRISQTTVDEIGNLADYVGLVERFFVRTIAAWGIQAEMSIREQAMREADNRIAEVQSSQGAMEELMQGSIAEYNTRRIEREKAESLVKEWEDRVKSTQEEIVKLQSRKEQEELLTGQLEVNRCEKMSEQLIQQKSQMEEESGKLDNLAPLKEERLRKLTMIRNAAEERYRGLRNSVNVESRYFYSKKQELEEKVHPVVMQIKEKQARLEYLRNDWRKSSSGTQVISQIAELSSKTAQLQVQQEVLGQSVVKQRELLDLIVDQKGKSQKLLEEQRVLEKQLVNNIQTIQSRLDQSNEDRVEKNQQIAILRSLYRASQQGHLKLVGRLGDLGAIDQKYDTAITTACPAFDGVVVETQEDAVRCVEYLKEQKLGRCLFIPIEKVPAAVLNLMEKPFQPIDQAQRLFDLIRIKDQRYRGVFYNFLRDTLVVQSLEVACKLAYGAHKNRRIVTLDGKLIDQSGVMSGGPQSRKGGMQSKLVEELGAEQREALLQERNRLKEQLDQAKMKIGILESRVAEANADEETVKSKYKQRVVDLNMILEQINENKSQEACLQQQLQQTHEEERRNIENGKEIEKLELEIQKLQVRIGQEQIELAEVDSRLKEIANQDLNQAKEEYFRLQGEFEQAEQEVQKLQAQKAAQLKKQLQIGQQVQEEQAKLQEAKTKVQRIQDQMRRTALEVKKLQDQEAGLRKEMEEHQAQVAKLDGECKKIQNEIRSFKQIIEDQEVERQQAQLKKNIEKKQFQELSVKLDNLKKEYSEIYQFFVVDDSQKSLLKLDSIGSTDLNAGNLFHKKVQEQLSITRSTFFTALRDSYLAQLGEQLPTTFGPEISLLSKEWLTTKLLEVSQSSENSPLKDVFVKDTSEKETTLTVLRTYAVKSREHQNRLKKATQSEELFKRHKNLYDMAYASRKKTFEQNFQKLKAKLKQVYFTLTNGGDADLDPLDSLDPFAEGLQFLVKPPNKTWKPISRLSGGEKTLASLSLMLALHAHRPAPVYILDEIDAALDYKNVVLIANYLNSIKAQFIIISLRPHMFEKANNLVGIYTVKGSQATHVAQLVVEEETEQ